MGAREEQATPEETVEPRDTDAWREGLALIVQYRLRCLWFIRPDYVPEDAEGMIRLLTYIERYGDREAFIRARNGKQWLSRSSSETSVAS
jgi:hypothetical protein